MSLSDGMQPNDQPKRRCSQRARPQTDGSIREKAVIGINQHLVPRLQHCYWELQMDSWSIARRERLPRKFVERLLRQNSVPIRPEPLALPSSQWRRKAA